MGGGGRIDGGPQSAIAVGAGIVGPYALHVAELNQSARQ
jgi:hypothetical protein